MKTTAGGEVAIPGYPGSADTIDVVEGWNLVPAPSAPLDAAEVGSEPAGIIVSHFFGYAAGYSAASVLEPGKGYWVKVSSAGKILFAPSGVQPRTLAPPDHPADQSGLRNTWR